MNVTKKHLLIFDPISFSGGSKKAVSNIIRLLPSESVDITIASANPKDWSDCSEHAAKAIKLHEFSFLAQADHGLLYFCRHIALAVQLLFICLFNKKVTLFIGTSGPGVDLALYIVRLFLLTPIFQFIQGPVATSRTIARCLLSCQYLCYLPSTMPSIKACLTSFGNDSRNRMDMHQYSRTLSGDNTLELGNGINREDWPSKVNIANCSGDVFWAASLLKWKRLDILTDALQLFSDNDRPSTSICYIRPKSTNLSICQAPQSIKNVMWYEQPNYLNEIRKNHKIFVSTSEKEPFGLSVLEALAAGMAVLIPADGAYWDKKLSHQGNCYKYKPNDIIDLKSQISALLADEKLLNSICGSGYQVAQQYRAEITYKPVIDKILSI